jgi:hypothetical protein
MVERRGRQDLQVVGFVPGEGRPGVPQDMSPDEGKIWKATVEAMPPGWFTGETHPLLRQYCTHVVLAERISKAARFAKQPARLAQYIKLLAQETGLVTRLARAMRLAPSTRLHKDSASTKVENQSRGRPWSASA